MANLFRGALFGYNKKDVQKYVEEICANFNAQLDGCRAEIDRLNSQKAEIEAQKIEIEKRKSAISEAIISAQEQGEKIIAQSREKGEAEYREMQNKIAEENQKLIKIRREIVNIRRSAIKTLNNLNIDAEDCEESDD